MVKPHPQAADVDGAILVQARADRETAFAYPELVESGQCRLVVVAIETGGRWSDEAVDIFRQRAFAKARESLPAMKWPVVLAWERRWTRMLATTCCEGSRCADCCMCVRFGFLPSATVVILTTTHRTTSWVCQSIRVLAAVAERCGSSSTRSTSVQFPWRL